MMMKLNAGRRAMMVGLAASLVPLVAFSSVQPLPLKHGVYVRGKSCTDPANAEILNWDGVGFSGAHSSHCTSQVTPQGKRFLVKNTCAAVGDGSPNAAAAGNEDVFSLTILSSRRFEFSRKNQKKAIYRWCSVGEGK
jgi:hypothetical protein